MIDYRKILKFYINYVGECEGTTFLNGNSNFDRLTAEENKALDDADREAAEEWRATREVAR
jgi:hypothetical protein